MNTHAQLHQYFRDSTRNDTGSIKEAYELSLAAEKHYAQQEAEIVNLKEKIASQANMIDKLQVKAGHVDLLREELQCQREFLRDGVNRSVFPLSHEDAVMICIVDIDQALEQAKEG